MGCEIRPRLPGSGRAHAWTSVTAAGLATVEERTASMFVYQTVAREAFISSIWAFLSGSISAHSYPIYSMLLYFWFFCLYPWSRDNVLI